LIPAITYSDLPAAMDQLFTAFTGRRVSNESFLDFSCRHSTAELQSFCAAKERKKS